MSESPATRIVHATLDLIQAEGVGAISMSAIARKAGVARQTLYNHYPDVDSIVYAAMDAHQQESLTLLTDLLDTIDSPAGRLEHLVRHTAAVAAHGHPSLKYGFSTTHQQLIAAFDKGMRALVETALSDGMTAGVFREDLNPAIDALLLQRMIEATGELVAHDPTNAAEAVAAAVHTVLATVIR